VSTARQPTRPAAGALTVYAPGGRPARTPAALQTTPIDDSVQNNTSLLGGPVTINNILLIWYAHNGVYFSLIAYFLRKISRSNKLTNNPVSTIYVCYFGQSACHIHVSFD